MVIGVKDSGADWPHTRRLLERFPALEILCGEETHLPQALALGGAGTICGLANFVPQLLRRLIASHEPDESARLLALLQALGAAIERHASFAQGLRVLIAELTGEPAWLRTLPPLVAARRSAARRAGRRVPRARRRDRGRARRPPGRGGGHPLTAPAGSR